MDEENIDVITIIIKDNSKFWTEQKSGRMYCRQVDSEVWKYPSVTTIMSRGKKFNGSPAASIGTLVHYHILKRYSKNLLPKPTDHIWNTSRQEVVGRVRRCLDMWESIDWQIDPICVETALFCHDPRYAGRMDMLAKVDGKLTLIDLKTGRHYPEHVIQAAAYWHALNRKPDVCFVSLDSILDRNPSQQASLKYFAEYELEKGWEKFLDLYTEFTGWE